uniref:Long-chain-fatty-acid--CoA ligase n=1 Tax=Echinococcus granulosus TaxID=6210 RepID=A0A068WW51_ECHGR|nr:long chain fatty acid transport protein 4 [Echinococcus granulosus]
MKIFNGKRSAKLFWITLTIAKLLLLCEWNVALSTSAFVYLITGGWRYARAVILTLPRDIFALSTLIRLYFMLWMTGWRKHGIRDVFAGQVKRKGRNTIAVLHLDSKWTYGDLDDYSNRVGNYLLSKGYKPQTNVALFMENEPKYIAIWLGASKVSLATGLINSNVRRDALVSCLIQLDPQAVFVGASLVPCIVEAGIIPEGTLLEGQDVIIFPPASNSKSPWGTDFTASQVTYVNLGEVLDASSAAPPPVVKEPKLTDVLIYVFTSGTSGLPKAAIITLSRYLFMSSAIHYLCHIYNDDVFYIPLPIYHTAGGIVGVGQMVVCGVQIVLRTRFSASKFWADCVKYNCTVIQYVGETLRYLLAQPYTPEETQHKVRLATGNGVRREIWVDFVKRFGIKRMGEFYGATESNSNLANSENRVGSLGYTSIILPSVYPVLLVKTDPETGEVIRNPKTNLCELCEYNEVGQLVGRIKRSSPIRNFEGYINRKETSRKVISNVKCHGDQYFLSGDLLVQDEFGYFYFVDRLGDTFRWRGENVSTTEVENLVGKAINFADCAVYGVKVPGNEGRAGMLALSLDKNADIGKAIANGRAGGSGESAEAQEIEVLKDLADVFAKQLPLYARPLFVRFMKVLDTTDTFKFKKINMMKTGFDITATKDRIYYLNTKTNVYHPLDDPGIANIVSPSPFCALAVSSLSFSSPFSSASYCV